ncbi:hypothetical protein QBC36DRAFT_197796 [Triangularia setosa]|uniref:Uncharacterized protein n=1 Tax=Triangularia setosa TaxID=2587417 RepID=A0AAN6W0G8_9PEZI|nr:hypothetical protein QBC36DRAFT_197796 [Podospora setosa]
MLRKNRIDDQPLNETYHYGRPVVGQIWKDMQSMGRSYQLLLRPLRQTPLKMAWSDSQSLSYNGLKHILVHIVLLMVHLFGVMLTPLALLYPLWLGLLIFMAIGAAHRWLCRLLNTRSSSIVYSRVTDTGVQRPCEAWIFLPRLGTTNHELENTLDSLSTIFRRQVTAIPSQTQVYGILPDMIRELFLRNTSSQTPMTQDVHRALFDVRRELSDPTTSKVVLLAYSSGAIHANIVVNVLLQQGLQHLLQKLEVYTFGGYFCHFNNPPIDHALLHDREEHRAPRSPTTGEFGVAVRKSVSHIEHFANADDPFALMGVLKKSNWSAISGDIFQLPGQDSHCQNQGGGYLFNKGYLNSLFAIAGQRPSAYSSTAELPVVGSLGNDPQEAQEDQDRKRLPPRQEYRRALKSFSRLYQYMDGREPMTVDASSIPPLHESP